MLNISGFPFPFVLCVPKGGFDGVFVIQE